MSTLDIHQFPCLSDNYGVLIRDPEAGLVASIDAPDAQAVKRALAEKGWTLTHILVTHHHADHTGGNLELYRDTGCTIIGPRAEADRIPGIETSVGEGEALEFGTFQVRILDTPGHTAGHISYHLPEAKVAFVGDTVFAMGCGRVIEGTPRMMWDSVSKVAKLPLDTDLYCGHEYTLSNARFAVTIEPGNAALQNRLREVEALRAAGKPTLPTRLGLELDTNPFLRPHVPAIRQQLGLEKAEDWQVFAEIRERKNRS